jgi:hypothetical protein
MRLSLIVGFLIFLVNKVFFRGKSQAAGKKIHHEKCFPKVQLPVWHSQMNQVAKWKIWVANWIIIE